MGLAEKLLGQLPVFGRNAQAPTMIGSEAGCDLSKICHSPNIKPCIGHRNDNISAPKTERRQQIDDALAFHDLFTDQIFARHTSIY